MKAERALHTVLQERAEGHAHRGGIDQVDPEEPLSCAATVKTLHSIPRTPWALFTRLLVCSVVGLCGQYGRR